MAALPTISGTDAQAYLDAHPYKDATGLDQINTQFWLSTVMNEYEAWCKLASHFIIR